MILDLLPANPDARREAEVTLRTASGLVVLLFIPTIALILYTFSPEHRDRGLFVAGGEMVIAGLAYINGRLHYRLYPATVTLFVGIIALGLGVTAAVHFRGSASSITPALYIFLIAMMTVYMTPQAGFVALVVSVAAYWGVQYAEYEGWLPYAPLHPDRERVAQINWGPTGRILELGFLCLATYVTAFYIAVTLRKRREQVETVNAQLRALDETKSRFLSIVSHDLRSPITSIRAYAELLGERVAAEDQQFSETIMSEADRLNRLVTDLLDLDKMEAGKMEWALTPQDIRPVLDNAVRVFTAAARDKNIDLRRSFDRTLPQVNADADRLAQLVANLISNAIKFTPEGGAVTVAAARNLDTIDISVADTGPGIVQDDLDRIFDRFSQTDTGKKQGGGTGLGLAIATEIATAHGGDLTVASTPGEGTVFTVTLPAPDASS